MIALTGTPGVGKTTVADELRKRGYKVTSVIDLAKKYDCVIDVENDEYVIDTEKLSKYDFDGIVEGHLSHLLNPSMVIVLRCNPIVLKERLIRRGWDFEKIMDNVEAELLDIILVEALESCDEVYEIDTTELDVGKIADAIEEIIGGKGEKYRPGKIDWLSLLSDRLDEVVRW